MGRVTMTQGTKRVAIGQRWDIKPLLRQHRNTSSPQQSPHISPEHVQHDPYAAHHLHETFMAQVMTDIATNTRSADGRRPRRYGFGVPASVKMLSCTCAGPGRKYPHLATWQAATEFTVQHRLYRGASILGALRGTEYISQHP